MCIDHISIFTFFFPPTCTLCILLLHSFLRSSHYLYHSFHLSLLTPLFLSFFCGFGSFCLACMALNTFGFSDMALLDGRNLTGDLLHTPNTPQTHLFTQNTSLFPDRTHNIHALLDSSPLVCDLIICASELYCCFFSP